MIQFRLIIVFLLLSNAASSRAAARRDHIDQEKALSEIRHKAVCVKRAKLLLQFAKIAEELDRESGDGSEASYFRNEAKLNEYSLEFAKLKEDIKELRSKSGCFGADGSKPAQDPDGK